MFLSVWWLFAECEREKLTGHVMDQLLSLTDTSPVGVAFSATSPAHWREISLQQYHRKVPTHMHSGRSTGGHAHHTRVWQYVPPSSSTSQPIRCSLISLIKYSSTSSATAIVVEEKKWLIVI